MLGFRCDVKVCATCEHWGGRRDSPPGSRPTEVNADPDSQAPRDRAPQGICRANQTQQRPGSSCPEHTKLIFLG